VVVNSRVAAFFRRGLQLRAFVHERLHGQGVAIRLPLTVLFCSHIFQVQMLYTLIFWLACIVLQDVFFLFLYYREPNSYRVAFRYGQFLSLSAGLRRVLGGFSLAAVALPGRRPSGTQRAPLVLALVASKIFADRWLDSTRLSITVIVLERNLRTVQAVALISLPMLLVYFAIPVNRTQRGVAVGSGLFVGTRVIDLTAADEQAV
jgi:hypothetical protein